MAYENSHFGGEQPDPDKFVRGLAAIILIFALLFLMAITQSCSTTKCIPQIEYQRHDSIVDHYHHDTLIIHKNDSVIVREKGDTVFIDHWRTQYVYKVVMDSTSSNTDDNTDIVQTEIVEVVPGYYKFCSWAFWIIAAIVVAFIVIKILIKIYIK